MPILSIEDIKEIHQTFFNTDSQKYYKFELIVCFYLRGVVSFQNDYCFFEKLLSDFQDSLHKFNDFLDIFLYILLLTTN